eukprot:COSAG05_NODE_79_length_21178_cov_133.299492_20_plen_82_part_00
MGQNEAGSIPSEEDSIFATSSECLIIRVITHAQERVNACNGAPTGLAHVNVLIHSYTGATISATYLIYISTIPRVSSEVAV